MANIERFKFLTEKAKNIVITTHIHPDADGIGSEITLCMALRQLGKEAVCVNEAPLLDRYRYLDPDKVVICFEEYQKEYADKPVDLFIVVDTNGLTRIGNNLRDMGKTMKNLLFIDHHPCAKELTALHCIDSSMAATGELVGNLIEALGISFTEKLALPLYTAILIDTSSFRYPTVSSSTHRMVAKLMDAGVAAPKAYSKIYGRKKITYMKMLGAILSSAETTEDGAVSWIVVTEEILKKYDVDPEDTHGLINNLLILDNVKIACMFREVGENIKISLRSAGDIDVGVMAQALGGGGHNHSAATLIKGTVESIIPATVQKLQIMLKG